MGIHPAPQLANIYLANRIDNKITRLALKYDTNDESALPIFKRFFNDIFQIFKDTTKQLHELFEEEK